MTEKASELARRLADQAEAVCRHYLSNGRREGRYWLVGDARNTPGRSLFVRLKGGESGRGAAGKWTDAATGDHGDLLDVIRGSCGLIDFNDVADEARRFLCLPQLSCFLNPGSEQRRPRPDRRNQHGDSSPCRSRFLARCYYRPDPYSPTETWPAMIAAVTGLAGQITGAHRTWLDPSGRGKAPVDTPKRAMGHLLGNAARFDVAHDVMAAGEGIETMLSLRCIVPRMPMVAALSAAHLSAIMFPATLHRLYIVRDDDPAGDSAMTSLIDRANEAGIEAVCLSPTLEDFNEDLRTLGIDALRAAVRVQIAPEDVARFMELPADTGTEK
jgi:Toprim domain